MLLACFACMMSAFGEEAKFAQDWKRNGGASVVFEINGSESRNNPLRRQLAEPLTGDEVFVRYRIRYDAKSIDTPLQDEGEFFVLWLDALEGNDQSTHSGGVPNIGVHVSENKNRFMVRHSSKNEQFAAEVVGDREFLLVAQLKKSKSGATEPYDVLNLWVDPNPEDLRKPDAAATSRNAVAKIAWLGFSTGLKTELEDRIFVRDISVSESWAKILNLPANHPRIEPPPIEKTIDFAKHVAPILKAKCLSCHAGNEADIRFDNHDDLLNLCTPGDAEASHFFVMITSGEMPPEDETQLTSKEVETLKTWINEGVDWNNDLLPPPVPTTDHWAFQKIVRPEIPQVTRTDWVRTPVDAFIARKHESLGVSPAPEASAETLARRLSLDLLGLPPDGKNRTVEELLSDPAYGERWGRHWLDVARWSESNGHQHNRSRLHAWRYRDWVIEQFNNDLPYDKFVLAQLAGDELSADTLPGDGAMIATGFLAAARYSGNELDKQIQRNDILVDITNTTANAFLGLTFECAQCHTHKFDPISIRDYYRLQAFFESGQPNNIAIQSTDANQQNVIDQRWEIFDRNYQRQIEIRRRNGHPTPELVLPKTVVKKMPAADRNRFHELEKAIAEFDQTWGFYSANSPQRRIVTPHEMRWPLPRDEQSLSRRETHILLRGDVNARGPKVKPGWPLVFGETGDLGEQPRKALARWMTNRNNPLTARVWVNRIWHWHFGKGLVETVGDFGKQGTLPTHPELLDFLAAELMENNWSTKHIHRLILNSATWRQSSQYSKANAAIDPENIALWRWTPRRLEAEAIRDSLLFASGTLNAKPGGPSDVLNGDSKRRSVYLKTERQRLSEQAMLFDGADALTSCSRRRVSTNSLQPLWLLNSNFSQQAAAALAERAGNVETAFKLCLGRTPNEEEKAILENHANKHGLKSACLVLFNSSEFLYLP